VLSFHIVLQHTMTSLCFHLGCPLLGGKINHVHLINASLDASTVSVSTLQCLFIGSNGRHSADKHAI